MNDTESSWIRLYWKELSGAVVVILGLIAIIAKIKQVATYIQGLVPVGSAGTGSAQITSSAAMLLAAFIVVFAAFFVLSIILLWKLVQARSSQQADADQALLERLDLFSAAYKSTITQSRKLVNRLYPTPDHPPHDLIEYRAILNLENDGDGSYTTRMKLKAADPSRPLHFTKSKLRVETEAPSAESLEEVGFSVKDLGETDVAHLLLENEPRFKRVGVFFLPSVDGSEEEPRSIEVAWHWPGMYRRLLDTGLEKWKVRPSSGSRIGLFSFEIYWSPHAVGDLVCSYDGPALGIPFDLKRVETQAGHAGWRFTAEGAPPAVEYVFKLELRDSR